MTLGALVKALQALRDQGASDESPVFVEGHDDADRFVQAYVGSAMTEARCEDEDEPQGVYLILEEVTIDD